MRFSASGRNIVQKKLQRHSFKVHMNNKQLFFLLKLETSFRQSCFHTTTRDSLYTTSHYRSRILTRHSRQISSTILLPKLQTSDAFVFLCLLMSSKFLKAGIHPSPSPPPLKNMARNSHLRRS